MVCVITGVYESEDSTPRLLAEEVALSVSAKRRAERDERNVHDLDGGGCDTCAWLSTL